MMPYLTLKNDITLSAFEQVVPRDQWGDIHHAFVVCEGTLADVEASDDAPTQAQAFALYWAERGRDIAANWELFTTLVSGAVYAAIWQAYIETRDTAFNADADLNAEPEGEAEGEAVGG